VTPDQYQRVKQIFHAALDLPDADRAPYVARETAGDPETQHEIERMLRHAVGTGLLDTPAWDGAPLESALQPGSRLGPYEVLEEAGAGGMGRVYRARDTRLGRTVAIKVLNTEFSHRLAMEGRAISALNHPHVCALYDIGDQDGTAYLVMEYVHGEPLSATLRRGPLPVDDVLRYGSQLAAALAEAHAGGIVHRDLKPANIMITAAGVKVLDFGVARMAQDTDTGAGGVAGTAAYMSPSQRNGNPADARSDIFALGLVLYEMATGLRYRGEAPASSKMPPGLSGLIEHCLQPSAEKRPQRMEDLRVALEQLRTESARGQSAWVRPAATAALLAVVAAAGLFIWRTLLPPPSPLQSLTSRPAAPAIENPAAPTTSPRIVAATPILPPRPPSLSTLVSFPGIERDPGISPDGTKVAFSWQPRGTSGFGIFVKRMNSAEPERQLTSAGGEEDWGAAWSPDGRTIAFRRRQAGHFGIYTVSANGGDARFLAALGPERQETLPQMSWSHDGKWIAAPDRDSTGTQLYLFSTLTGERRLLTRNAGGTDHAPAFSPDGKKLAYTSCIQRDYPCDIYVIEFARDMTPRVVRRTTEINAYVRGIAWLPGGRELVYSAAPRSSPETSLWRLPLDPPGEPVPITLAGQRAHHPAIASAGATLVFTRMIDWNLKVIRNFR
jgi:eukaryotic-like serine/threonine-protein kinase